MRKSLLHDGFLVILSAGPSVSISSCGDARSILDDGGGSARTPVTGPGRACRATLQNRP